MRVNVSKDCDESNEKNPPQNYKNGCDEFPISSTQFFFHMLVSIYWRLLPIETIINDLCAFP